MANKKLIYLFAGYITGTIIASLYSNKNGDAIRKEMKLSKEKGEFEDKKVLFDHFLDLHKRLVGDIAQDKNVKKTADVFNSYKETFHKFFDSSKSEIINILKEHKSLGEQDIQEISTKLQSFVKEKFDSGIQSVKNSLNKVSETLQKEEELLKSKKPSTSSRKISKKTIKKTVSPKK